MKIHHLSEQLLSWFAWHCSLNILNQIRKLLRMCELCQKRLKDGFRNCTQGKPRKNGAGGSIEHGPRRSSNDCKYNETIPADRIPDQGREIHFDKAVLRSIARDRLRTDSLHSLLEKLDGDLDAYVHRDLWVGEKTQDGNGAVSTETCSASPSGKQPVWKRFDINRLTEPGGDNYLIFGHTGVGKTTLLRFVQVQILKSSPALAVYFKVADMDDIISLSIGRLAERLGSAFGGTIPEEYWEYILCDAFDRKQLVLLIDGLDDIDETNISITDLVREMVGNTEGNSLIITARPSLATELEKQEDLKLFWLAPFDREECKIFFSDFYEKAQQLCRHNEQLLSFPVYARLVRELVRTGQNLEFWSRWGTYSSFVNHRLNIALSHIEGERRSDFANSFLATLGRVAYEAIAQKDRMLEIIPYRFWSAYWKDSPVPAEVMATTKIAGFVISATKRDNPSLVFTHRSFQEFLGARWAVESDERISHIFHESRKPKWKEVIKFLSGALGEDIIRRLYELGRKDEDSAYRLFLAAECCREVTGSEHIQTQLLAKLVDQASDEPDALTATSRLNTHQAADAWVRFLEGHIIRWPASLYSRAKLAEALSDSNAILLTPNLHKIAHLLRTEDDLIYDKVIELLSRMADHLTLEHITEIMCTACSRGDIQRILILPRMVKCISQYYEGLLNHFSQEEDQDVRDVALAALARLGGEQPNNR